MTTFSNAIWSFDVKPEFAEHERGRHLTGGSELDSALLRPRRGHFQRAVDAHPSNSNALFQLGMCALELGPLEMAIELMNKSCWSKFAVIGTAQNDHSPKMDGQIHKTTIFIKFCGSNDAPFFESISIPSSVAALELTSHVSHVCVLFSVHCWGVEACSWILISGLPM